MNSHHTYSHLHHPSSADNATNGDDDELIMRYSLDASISSVGPNRRQKRRAVVLFSMTVILLFADQNLMAPNLTAMARDFGFTDSQRDTKLGGDIALAFFFLGAPASYAVGILADSSWMPRVRLFAIVVGLGEGACAMTFITTKYWQLYLCRAVTGFSLGGALPLIYSILGDLYAADQRHMVSSLVGIGSGIGIALGQGVAGFIGPTYGWRLPFLVVGIPALLCAALVLLMVEEPERGGMEQAVRVCHEPSPELGDENPDLTCGGSSDFKQEEEDQGDAASVSSDKKSTVELSSLDYDDDDNEEAVSSHARARRGTVQSQTKKSNLHRDLNPSSPTLAQRIENGMLLVDETPDYHRIEPEGHYSAFRTLLRTPTVGLALLQGGPGCIPWGIVNTYLNDFLAENRGMSVEFATTTLLMFGLGTFLGMLLGGVGGSYLYKLDLRYPSLLAGGTAILSCVCFWILLNHIDNTTPLFWIAVVAISTGLTSGTTGPIVKATLQNVTHPQARGQAFALLNTFDDFGRGLGPVFVAALIESMEGNRTRAFTLGALGWMVCGFINTGIFWTVKRDEESLQQRILFESRFDRSRTNSRCLDEDDEVGVLT